MKTLRHKWVCLLVFYAIGRHEVAFPQEPLQIKWGLENTVYFEERQMPKTPADHIAIEKRDSPTRSFSVNNEYPKALGKIMPRVQETWKLYMKEGGRNDPAEERRKKFSAFLKEKDPYSTSMVQALAPTLYFDFLGTKGKEYVLEEIEVETIRFSLYAGGGFRDREAWYDIEVSSSVGIRKYPIENGKLRFDGSGRSQLRLSSDVFSASQGMSYLGDYTIRITFHFIEGGKRVSVSTAPFNIDI